MKPEYIKNFEQLGLGLFCHFGLYSSIKKGEWIYWSMSEKDKAEYPNTINKFKISKRWAKDLVGTAKEMGAKYITLTTRHHDGFSLYDNRGLNEYDAPHSPTGRDLIKEFVDECNKQGIVPFFYHTLLDWHEPHFEKDFKTYLQYLRDSIENLCTHYGKVGGFWFDGSWSKDDISVWEFSKLYKIIRKYQPEAMIINNTGLSATGQVSDPEIDSVTFERGKPFRVGTYNNKEIAGEMCDGITDHWGYAQKDLNTKPFKTLLHDFIVCRKCNCNYLINTGLLGNGLVNPIEKETLKCLGFWINENKKFIYGVKDANIEAINATILKDDNYYYAVVENVPMSLNVNVTKAEDSASFKILTDKKICNAIWLDTKKPITPISKKEHIYPITPFDYGVSMYARVMRFKLK